MGWSWKTSSGSCRQIWQQTLGDTSGRHRLSPLEGHWQTQSSVQTDTSRILSRKTLAELRSSSDRTHQPTRQIPEERLWVDPERHQVAPVDRFEKDIGRHFGKTSTERHWQTQNSVQKDIKDSGLIQERHQVISLDRLAETVEDISSKTLGELIRKTSSRHQKRSEKTSQSWAHWNLTK